MTHVVILGGGVAGMSAAQELAERGFEVSVYELRDLPGGKARSMPVAARPGGGEFFEALDAKEAGHGVVPWIPGEHGFRFFPGFYKHVIDTMERIPTDGGFVSDNLVDTTRIAISQYERQTFALPDRFPKTPSDIMTVIEDLLIAFSPTTELHPDDVAFFGSKIWKILTSSADRRLKEYEQISWWEFVGAEERSAAYQKFLASGITRSLVAAKAKKASTRTIGDIFIQLILTIIDPSESTTDRVLDGPTNLAWINPWLAYLKKLGVNYQMESTVESIRMEGKHVTGAAVRHNNKTETVIGDIFISALPVERLVPLLDSSLMTAAPSLSGLPKLAQNVEWMNGVMFYLRRDLPMTHGHIIHIDTEWALTSISQIQFWKPDTLKLYGDDEVRGILSVDVSDWMKPGLNGRQASECSREEVGREVWAQLQRSLNVDGEIVLRDEDLVGWFLDADIAPDPNYRGKLRNSEPLLVNLINSWCLRPDAITESPNFFLASDYVRTYTDLATMEGANEAARRAVNGILDYTGSNADRCKLWPLQEPLVLEPLRRYDQARFEQGLPWDSSLSEAVAKGVKVGAPVMDLVPEIASNAQAAVPIVQAANNVMSVFNDPALYQPIDPLRDAAGLALTGSPVVSPSAGFNSVNRSERSIQGPVEFDERLAWYRELSMSRLHAHLPEREPDRFLYGLIRDFVNRPGKGIRPGLLLATLGAHGGKLEDALDVAAALELLHNAFLAHDDIEDGSLSRRGRPTLHATAGVPLAINVGDAMNALALGIVRKTVRNVEPRVALALGEEIDHLLLESLEGQALELGWTQQNNCDVNAKDYFNLVLKKTSWYSFIHPMRIGALLAGEVNLDSLDRFNRFGSLMGAAFQIQDDVLNLVGDSRYGKEIGGDLWEGKRTIILSHAFASADHRNRNWLEQFFSRPRERRLPREVEQASSLLNEIGSIEWAKTVAEDLGRAAVDEFEIAFSSADEGPDTHLIRSLVEFVSTRNV